MKYLDEKITLKPSQSYRSDYDHACKCTLSSFEVCEGGW